MPIDPEILQRISNTVNDPEFLRNHRPLRNPNKPREIDAILRIALNNTGLSFSSIANRCSRELGWRIEQNVGWLLRDAWITQESQRIAAREVITSITEAFNTIIRQPNTDTAREMHRQLQSWLAENHGRGASAIARVVLIQQVDQMRESEDPAERRFAANLYAVLDQCGLGATFLLFRSLVRSMLNSTLKTQRPSLTEQIGEMIAETNSAAGDISKAHEEQLDPESLAEKNSDLRATLFALNIELKSLQEQIHALQASSAETTTARFLSELNNSSSGSLLDNLVHSSRAIKQLQAQGWQPEPIEVEGVIATLTLLADHLLQLGVTPIHEIGSTADITMKDLAEITYIGSEFTSAEDHKTVRFRSPGWRYQQQIVALPRAVEVSVLKA